MHTILKTVIILYLLATYWCTGNSDTDKLPEFQEEKTVRPTYSSSNVVSRSSSHSSLGDAVSQSSAHFDAGKIGMPFDLNLAHTEVCIL
jgi:hypothetical protein